MTARMPIHEVKDRLSSVIAQLTETGEEVEITKHGRVVAVLVPPRPAVVVLGLGASTRGHVPTIDELRWDDEALREMFGGSAFPA